MQTTILTIGDEILIGQIVDTNSAWIGQELNAIGCKIHEIISVSDDAAHIKNALHRAASQSQLVLITGGLGPTKDDITKKTLCEYFQTEEVFHAESFEKLRVIFEKRGKELLEINKKQAMLPANCEVIPNERGTAPGMWFCHEGVYYMSMPGVPHEMKHIMTHFVIPKIQKLSGLSQILHKNLMTVGIGESSIAQRLEAFENALPPAIKLAYLPDLGIVKLRLSAYQTTSEIRQILTQKWEEMKQLLSEFVYAENDIKLEERIGELCLEKKVSLAFAESCTGGYAGHLITSVAGSSAYFEGSTVVYSYDLKKKILGVKEETLLNQGAVSEECVQEMLEGLFKISTATVGVAISGIAGPEGGTALKPVGTVCFAWGSRTDIRTKTFHFYPRRMENIRLASVTALNLVRKFIEEKN